MIFNLLSNYPNIQRTDKHVLKGTVLVNGEPGKKLIVVFLKNTHSPIASTYSDETTGKWRISNINVYPSRGLYVLAFDIAGEFNGDVIDFVSQVIDPDVTFRDLTPSDFNPLLWLDPSDASTVTVDSGHITQVTDKSIYNRHATQTTVSTAPTYVDGRIRFESADQFLELENKYSPEQSVFIVTEVDKANFIIMSYDGNHLLFAASDSLTYTSAFSANCGTFETFVAGTQLSAERRGEYHQAVNNKVAVTSTLGNTLTWLSPIKLGNFSESDTTYNFVGDILELIIIKGGDPVKQQKIEGYLHHKYGITDQLPSDHTFKEDTPIVEDV